MKIGGAGVAILVAAGCNVREVSEWAGHNSVAFTLTRYGGLFEDGSEAAVDRLDALLGGGSKDSDHVRQLDTRKLSESRKSPGVDSYSWAKPPGSAPKKHLG